MSPLLTVLRKELIDGVRDRRSLVSAMLFPMLIPFLITFLFNTLAEREREAYDITIPVVGGERAPDLVDWIQRRGFQVEEGPADPQEAVRSRQVDFVLVIPEGFGEDFSQARTAEVELVLDGSRKEAHSAIRRVRGLVDGYSRLVGSLRLVARGVSPQLGQAVAIDEVDVASARKRAASWFSFIPMVVIFAAFIGGQNVAIDTTAGERERNSLEPLLVQPVPMRSVVAGKWLASVVFSGAGVSLAVASLIFALNRVPLQQLGIDLQLGPREALGLLAAALPLALFASGLQVLVATFARSFKEAQTYVSLLILLPMVPHLIASVSSLGDAPWMYLVPALGQHVLLTDILGGEPFTAGPFVVVALSSTLLGLLCAGVTAKLFERERIVFGR